MVGFTIMKTRSLRQRLLGIGAIVSALALGSVLVWWNHRQASPALHTASASTSPLTEAETETTPSFVLDSANSGFGMISGSKSIGRPIFSTRNSEEGDVKPSDKVLLPGSKSFTVEPHSLMPSSKSGRWLPVPLSSAEDAIEVPPPPPFLQRSTTP